MRQILIMERNVRGLIVGIILAGFLLYVSQDAPIVNRILGVTIGFFCGFLGEKYLFK
jgi:hypothetical protein